MPGFEQRSLDDYIDVAQRIADFRAMYPEGSLRPWNPEEPYRLLQAQGFDKGGEVVQQTFLVVVAAAYRNNLDANPGIGMAWEIFPGRTPYTRGSELQNAETSAWGRAIIAVGASDSKKGIASREEVRNRQAERDDVSTPNAQDIHRLSTTPDDDPWQRPAPQRAKPAGWLLSERFADLGVNDRQERLDQCSEIVGRPVGSSSELEPGEVAAILEALQKRELAS